MNPDFVALLREFEKAGVRYLIIGAYALAHHARPRSTGDLDLWIDPTAENAGRVHHSLRAFGAPLADLTEQDLASPNLVYQIGIPPRRIDLLTTVTGLVFDDAWAHRVEASFGDLVCPFLGREDLIRNKRAVGRPRDLADLEDLGA